MTHKTPQWFRSLLIILQNYWRCKTKVHCFFASLIDQPVIASRIHAIRDSDRSNGKRHVQVRAKLGRTSQEVAGVISLWNNHLSSTCHALFTRVLSFATCSPRGCYALRIRALHGVKTIRERARNNAGLRPDLQSVLTQWWDELPFRCKPQKIRFPQSRLICRGETNMAVRQPYWSCNGSTSQLPYCTTKSIHRVATNTIVLSQRANRNGHARPRFYVGELPTRLITAVK